MKPETREKFEQEWASLEVVKHDNGSLLFKSEVRRRDSSGKVITEPCYVRPPMPDDHVQARVEAIEFFRKRKLDREADKDIFEEIESVAIMARSIRTYEPPHSQHSTLDEIVQQWDEGCVMAIKAQIDYFKTLLDPRDSVVEIEEFWEVIRLVKERANLGPLVDIAGHDQPTFLLLMAWEAWNSKNAPWFAQSSEISTQEL